MTDDEYEAIMAISKASYYLTIYGFPIFFALLILKDCLTP